MKLDKMEWTRPPKDFFVGTDSVKITTEPFTDLWQRTYYHFRNDNAPLLQQKTKESFFSFTVKTAFHSKARFDQSGIVVYLDSENWLKASVEYENEKVARLGSVVTNHGWSDWATVDVPSSLDSLWFRLSRRESDFCIEQSKDGIHFEQMRICHLFEAKEEIRFGVYACSPEDSSFCAAFSHFDFGPCRWKPHDGQAPDNP